MTIEQRLANLEKGYKQLCQAHDRNKQMHLLIKNNLDSMNQNFKEMTTLIKGQIFKSTQSMTSEITTQSMEGESSIYKNTDSFEFAQRQAKSLCESNLVPKGYQGQQGLPNCLVALEMSKRMTSVH